MKAIRFSETSVSDYVASHLPRRYPFEVISNLKMCLTMRSLSLYASLPAIRPFRLRTAQRRRRRGAVFWRYWCRQNCWGRYTRHWTRATTTGQRVEWRSWQQSVVAGVNLQQQQTLWVANRNQLSVLLSFHCSRSHLKINSGSWMIEFFQALSQIHSVAELNGFMTLNIDVFFR